MLIEQQIHDSNTTAWPAAFEPEAQEIAIRSPGNHADYTESSLFLLAKNVASSLILQK